MNPNSDVWHDGLHGGVETLSFIFGTGPDLPTFVLRTTAGKKVGAKV